MYGQSIGSNHYLFPVLRRCVAGYFGKLAERMAKGEDIAAVCCAQELRSEGYHFFNATPIAFTGGVTMDHLFFPEKGYGKKRKLDEITGTPEEREEVE